MQKLNNYTHQSSGFQYKVNKHEERIAGQKKANTWEELFLFRVSRTERSFLAVGAMRCRPGDSHFTSRKTSTAGWALPPVHTVILFSSVRMSVGLAFFKFSGTRDHIRRSAHFFKAFLKVDERRSVNAK